MTLSDVVVFALHFEVLLRLQGRTRHNGVQRVNEDACECWERHLLVSTLVQLYVIQLLLLLLSQYFSHFCFKNGGSSAEWIY